MTSVCIPITVRPPITIPTLIVPVTVLPLVLSISIPAGYAVMTEQVPVTRWKLLLPGILPVLRGQVVKPVAAEPVLLVILS